MQLVLFLLCVRACVCLCARLFVCVFAMTASLSRQDRKSRKPRTTRLARIRVSLQPSAPEAEPGSGDAPTSGSDHAVAAPAIPRNSPHSHRHQVERGGSSTRTEALHCGKA